jgi:hypothetical protein
LYPYAGYAQLGGRLLGTFPITTVADLDPSMLGKLANCKASFSESLYEAMLACTETHSDRTWRYCFYRKQNDCPLGTATNKHLTGYKANSGLLPIFIGG